MKKAMKKKLIQTVYAVIGNARLSSLKKNDDKVAVLKVLRELRYVANRYDEDVKDASERLKPDGFDELRNRAAVYEAERLDGMRPAAMSAVEYQGFLDQAAGYKKAVDDVMRDVDEATVDLEFEPVASDILQQLMDDNRWTVDQYLIIEEALTE